MEWTEIPSLAWETGWVCSLVRKRTYLRATANESPLLKSSWFVSKDLQSLGLQGDQPSQSLKEINPEYSLEGPKLKLKLQYSGHLMQTTNFWKRPWCWQILKAKGEESSRGWMVGWHHQFSGHALVQTLGDGEGQGSLVCCSPWGCMNLTQLCYWTTQ